MPTLTIDGREITVEPGTTVIQAAEQLGIFIPRYCWHPGLAIAGNCRICQVEVVTPKFRWPTTIACNLTCGDGMEIRTDSEEAKKARAEVMEFLLINHPLDCPICDQAGECTLQEYSFEHGQDKSDFDEEKVHKSKRIEFSDKITYDGERCILCTRCVRFAREVGGDEQLAVVERGDHCEIAVAHGGAYEHPYSMNVTDLCPVGALTSTDFRFKTRVWFLTDTPTTCGSCARGCSITVGARWDKVQRFTPRENADVNKWWMCDEGRLNYKFVHGEDRLGGALVRRDDELVEAPLSEALDTAQKSLAAVIEAHGADAVFGLVSARLTNEEIFVAKEWLSKVGVTNLDVKARVGEGDDFLISGDKNPNSTGAQLIGVGGVGEVKLDGLSAAVKAGTIKAVVVLGDDLDDHEALGNLSGLECVIVMDFRMSETAKKAHVVLPGCTWVEKEGTFTNCDGWVSKVNPAISAPAHARPDFEILVELLRRADPEGEHPGRPEKAFQALGEAVPAFAGMKVADLYARSVRVAEEAVPASAD
ncbi:MAG: molybdopterin-dependent oxidoreductase [Planctomycetota bacterium]